MYKRILVPVDGSATSTAGLQQALRFARDQKAKLRIIHIVDEAVLAEYSGVGGNAEELIQTMIDDGKKTLRDAMKLAKQRGIKAESIMYEKLLCPLADLILKEAKKWRADVIVMGTHARSGVKRFFLGSEAEAIVRASRLPVLLIHGAAAKRKRATRRKS
jgi:nucleotide-binding universal stress UspA family protein